MAVTERTVTFSEESLTAAQEHLTGLGLDGWLLYEFHGANPIAGGILGLPALTRRFFVLIPASGRPIALTHRIEQQPWTGWIGEKRVYLDWQSLERELDELLRGRGRIALEYSPGGAVPYLDRVPGGILEIIRRTGVEPVSSGDLVSAFYSRWDRPGEESHRRAAKILREVVHEAFGRIGDQLRAGDTPTEWGIRSWILSRLESRGLKVGADSIVAVNANAANPHYAPSPEQHAPIELGDLVLIDLWGKESPEGIFADQTWMAFVGDVVPDRIQKIWITLRDARDAAVEFIRERHESGRAVAGYEVDDVARALITEHGFGEAFLHRTGHSIDRELHGSGPNIDNLETRDGRTLIQGIGFSIEPGIYLPGDLGFRSEVDVFMAPGGPIVTTPDPQREIYRIRV
jgi:Xaa-Pro dipeptidase